MVTKDDGPAPGGVAIEYIAAGHRSETGSTRISGRTVAAPDREKVRTLGGNTDIADMSVGTPFLVNFSFSAAGAPRCEVYLRLADGNAQLIGMAGRRGRSYQRAGTQI